MMNETEKIQLEIEVTLLATLIVQAMHRAGINRDKITMMALKLIARSIERNPDMTLSETEKHKILNEEFEYLLSEIND